MQTTFLQDTLSDLEKKGLRRGLRNVKSTQGRKINIDAKVVLNFCSNNYLGLADDSRLCKAAIEAVTNSGLGSGASRLVCGNMNSFTELENKIASFKNTEKCLVFSTGYMANVGIISSLCSREDIIFSDRLNHASIIDGILLSQAKFKRYPHKDMDALEAMLKSAEGFRKKIIITDSVFSMDGDIAPLDKLVKLAKENNCILMIDEAHAFGVLGKNGKGAAEHFGFNDEIDIQMGTLSKAAGSFGAYVCGSNELISFLINRARSFIYTTGMPPSIAAASSKAIDIIKGEPQRRQKLWENTDYVLKELKSFGFDTLESQTPIIPIIIKDSDLTLEFSKRLFEDGIFISAIRPPTVPRGTSRLRVTVMATHTRDDLDYLLKNFKRIGKELCLI